MISFTVPGEPIPWARSRHRGSHHFTAPRQKAHAATVAAYAIEARPRGFALLTGPLELVVIAQFGRTRTCRNRFQPHDCPVPTSNGAAFWHPTNGRLDGDNLAKQIADAIRGTLIVDDGPIVDWRVWKVCSDEEPCTRVQVRRIQ